MRKILCLLAGGLSLCLATRVHGQSRLVTGKVTDPTGAPIPGATIRIKNEKGGTSADSKGVFKLDVPPNATLTVSAIGFEAREVPVGSAAILTISLTASTLSMSEVVVTAMGIRREKKALGYAVSTVDKKDLELRPEGDLARVLSGKAPGLNVLGSSGLSGSGTNIVIRGISSISGNSDPLFIVDGVPFNGNTNTQSDFTYGNQTSSRFLDLDPNNIESVSVLKGLSATTLYGEAGRNGVILITTKTGSTQKTRKKTEISVAQSVFTNTVANLPEYEQHWGGGFDLSLGATFFSNWGAKITDPPTLISHPYDRAAYNAAFPQFIGATYEYKFYNSVKNFFRTGIVDNTSVNVAGSAGAVNYNLNYSYMDDQGFTPGNGMIRNTFGLGGTAKLSNRFTVTGTINYVITNVTSPPTSPSFGSSASHTSVFGDLLYTPVTIDLMGLPYQSPIDGSSVYYRPSNDIQNPRWTVANASTRDNVNRGYGSLQFKYDIMQGLSLSYRLGFDNYTEFESYAQNKGGIYYPLGIYRSSTGLNTIWDHTFLLNYTKDLNGKWRIDVDAGANSRENIYKQTGYTSTEQLVFGLMDHSNFVTHTTTSENGDDLDYTTRDQTVAAFAQAVLGYKEYMYLTAGGRNSWTSTLEKNHRHLFYPSTSVSFIPTSAIPALQNSKNVNYLKLRFGYATSARFPDAYTTRSVLDISTKAYVDRSGVSVNTNAIDDLLPNPDLRPELQKEFETGVEGRFLDNRVTVDLTLYRRTAQNQILKRDLDPSTGYTAQQINAGDVTNKGIELALGYTVIRTDKWRWQLDGLYTLNRSTVNNLPSDLKQVEIAGYSDLGNFAMNGKPFGVIQGYYVQRDAKTGKMIVNSSGDYLISSDIGIIGDPNPLYKVTGISTLAYKAFSFRMQWEFTKGGDMYSSTASNLVGRGVTRDTDFDRAQPLILPGVKEDGTPNDIQTSATEAYFDNLVGTVSNLAVYDATLVRLREVSLSYNLPSRLLTKTPFGSLSFTLSGNNLWYYAPNFPKYVHFDPETSGFGVSNGRGLEFFSGPTSRRMGASVRVSF